MPLTIFICFFIGLILLELLYFKIADHYNIVDRPNHRSSHNSITIRGGGILFGVAAIAYYFYSHFQLPYFIAGVIMISLISFLDDVVTLNNKVRLFIHIVSVFLLFYQLNLFVLPLYWTILASIFVIGSINAYNFMDGINGITGAYSLLTIITFYYIDSYVVNFTARDLLLIVGLSLLVFNFFNFRIKAVCFAGDVGSVGIAFIILFLLLQLMIRTEDLSYLLLLLVYGLDAITTIIFRLIRGENIFEAHRTHFYQYWTNERKMPHLMVSIYYVLVQIIVTIFMLFFLPHSFFLLCLSLFGSATVFVIIRFAVEGSSRLLGK